jgi:hypothetical protein
MHSLTDKRTNTSTAKTEALDLPVLLLRLPPICTERIAIKLLKLPMVTWWYDVHVMFNGNVQIIQMLFDDKQQTYDSYRR